MYHQTRAQTTLNSDAYEPLYIQLDTGIVKGILSCPDFFLEKPPFRQYARAFCGSRALHLPV